MSRRAGRGLVLLAAALGLTACQTGGGTPPATTAAEATAAEASAAEAPATPAAAPARQVTARPPQPQLNDDPHQLMGLDRNGVAALLGAPDLVRREAPAEIWQYVGSGCVFEVVLYARGRDYAVSYLEARDASAEVRAPRPCLNSLLRARQATPVG